MLKHQKCFLKQQIVCRAAIQLSKFETIKFLTKIIVAIHYVYLACDFKNIEPFTCPSIESDPHVVYVTSKKYNC